MYMGFLNNFAQGAINDSGLMFDGFYEPYLEIKNTEGKLEIDIGEALKLVMQTMSTCKEVKTYLETVNLSSLTTGQIVFVDRQGTYLIIEGDEMIIGDEPEKTFSNFYYSQTSNLDGVDLPYYQKGREFLNTSKTKSTLEYCGEAMQNFSQNNIAPKQYSTVYDLKKLKIRVYLFQEYDNYVELDLKKELAKGNYKGMIPELFSETTVGYENYLKYNNSADPTAFIKEIVGDAEVTEQEYTESGFGNILKDVGLEWLYDIKDSKGAINVFKYGIDIMPNNSDMHYYLGKSYAENKNWENAIKSYAQALILNPTNPDAAKRISEAQEEMKLID